MSKNRTDRLNSLLKEVLSEVIRRDMHHEPNINEFISITRVDITKDLKFAKVYISIIGNEKSKKDALDALDRCAGYIGVLASKKVVMRYFPTLTFVIDEALENQLRMEEILFKISSEREKRLAEHSEANE